MKSITCLQLALLFPSLNPLSFPLASLKTRLGALVIQSNTWQWEETHGQWWFPQQLCLTQRVVYPCLWLGGG